MIKLCDVVDCCLLHASTERDWDYTHAIARAHLRRDITNLALFMNTFFGIKTVMNIVFDLEATCGDIPHSEREIIQIGACVVNDTFDIIDEFNEYVRPVQHLTLTEFCVNLTKITQDRVDNADPFPLVFRRFLYFISKHTSTPVMCSWGDYDRKQIIQDCIFHGIKNPLDNFVNLKYNFSKRNKRKQRGLSRSLGLCGLDFEGQQHSALDDAKNTARLLPWIFGDKRIE